MSLFKEETHCVAISDNWDIEKVILIRKVNVIRKNCLTFSFLDFFLTFFDTFMVNAKKIKTFQFKSL